MICEIELTSSHSPLNAPHSTLGNMFLRNSGWMSCSTISSSASLGWSGKARFVDLQALRAQVRKLSVRSFIFMVERRLCLRKKVEERGLKLFRWVSFCVGFRREMGWGCGIGRSISRYSNESKMVF
jgi:hypothetical protein